MMLFRDKRIFCQIKRIFSTSMIYKLSPPKIVEKGWGREVHLVNFQYCAKYLDFNKGARFSFHFHLEKTETFFLLSGKVEVEGINLATSERYTLIMEPGEAIHVPAVSPHRITALEDSRILEVSTHDDSGDNYRIEPGDSQDSKVRKPVDFSKFDFQHPHQRIFPVK